MDSETALRRVVSEVSSALTKYAELEKWNKEEYWIYYYINSDWNNVNFVFVSRHFKPEEEREDYVKVWEFLINYFKDEPEILRYSSVLVRSKAKVDEGGLYGISPRYHDFHEFWTFDHVPQT